MHVIASRGRTIMKSGTKKRILVVDDEDVILFSYSKIFQREGLDVDVCKNPEEALVMIRDNFYNAVLSDIRFSDSESMEGLDTLRYVREHRPETAVILMTGYGSVELREKAFDLGAAFYFDKPVAISTIDESLMTLGILPEKT
jgi:DNA-binding NtrC family response regulator